MALKTRVLSVVPSMLNRLLSGRVVRLCAVANSLFLGTKPRDTRHNRQEWDTIVFDLYAACESLCVRVRASTVSRATHAVFLYSSGIWKAAEPSVYSNS